MTEWNDTPTGEVKSRPMATVLIVSFSENTHPNACPKCKKDLVDGEYFIKFEYGGDPEYTTTVYLKGGVVECCGEKHSTLWSTNDAKEAGRQWRIVRDEVASGKANKLGWCELNFMNILSQSAE